jgi:uncharacterized protein YqgV (UPF0045/DUF77 family)
MFVVEYLGGETYVTFTCKSKDLVSVQQFVKNNDFRFTNNPYETIMSSWFKEYMTVLVMIHSDRSMCDTQSQVMELQSFLRSKEDEKKSVVKSVRNFLNFLFFWRKD